MRNSIVITTIQEKTKAIDEFQRLLPDWNILIVGDAKSPSITNEPLLTFFSVDDQNKLDLQIAKLLPFNHYVRKNIGYIIALKEGADLIYDTDDDNIPYEHWHFPDFRYVGKSIAGNRFVNVYSYFSEEKIWPRGFPLTEINKAVTTTVLSGTYDVGVWQGLADLDPDVDAIFRLTASNTTVKFGIHEPFVLQSGTYSPFNSQNTLWSRDMLPYAYLPSTVSFRFTDILRGYIAQRCFWQHNKCVGFVHAIVYQERNQHDLLKDFELEISFYLNIEKLVAILEGLKLTTDPFRNLQTVYRELAVRGIVEILELEILDAWIADIRKYI